MTPTIERTWELLEKTVEQLNKQSCEIVISLESKDRFKKIFKTMYNDIKENYMINSVEHLDRHKVASIIIVSILKSNAITYNMKVEQNKEFFGQYLIAASVGITFMQNQLNKILIEKQMESIKRIWFPTPISCNTPYFDVFCRNLYYSNNNNDWGLNPLDIAEKLFLFEYITLEKCGINPQSLK